MTPAPFDSYLVFGDGVAIGNTLMANPPPALVVNTVLLPESSANLGGIPPDAVLQDVYLWWSGSLPPGAGVSAIDTDALLILPDGASLNVSADTCQSIVTTFGPGLGTAYRFYYCRANVTEFVAAHPGMLNYNGTYTVGDVYADPGKVMAGTSTCLASDVGCQAKYAAWSMAFVYDSPTATLQRDVKLYDGFVHLDEKPGSIGIVTFTIDGFLVGTPPEAEIQWFGMEGDRQLGGGAFGHCATCPDFFNVNGIKLDDGNGAEGADNVFDSTIALSVDLDNVAIGTPGYGILGTGATSATISVGTGTNPAKVMEPTGESIFLGWVFLRLNRPSPNFRGPATNKFVNPTSAATGQTLFYSANVANQGSLVATNVQFTDTLPAGVVYQANSVQVDGVPCTDAADADPCTVSGGTITVKLGTIPSTGDNDRLITFRGTLAATGSGTTVCNVATVTSTETPTAAELGPACTTVTTATIGQPTKSATDLTGGVTGPGEFVQFTITIPGDPASPVGGVVFEDDVPAYMKLVSTSPPPGATNESTSTGGANGNGKVRLTGISIPAGGSVTFSFLARVFTEAEFGAAGKAPGAIHDTTICNQGVVSAGFLPDPVTTDDTTTPAAWDATCFTVTYAPLFGASSKTVVDLNGAPLERGDTLRYTITLVNSGNRNGTISLDDSMPAATEGFTLLSPLIGATFQPPPAGTNGTGRFLVSGLVVPAGTTATIQFEVKIKADAADGAVVVNVADLTVAERPEENRTLTSPTLVVYARPELGGLTKTVTDLNGSSFEPGDVVRYDLSVTNAGNVPATNVVLTDVVDANLTNVVVTGGGGTFDAATRTITWTAPSLAVGATFTASFEAQIVAPLPNGTKIPNQATIDSDEPAPAQLSDDPSTAAIDDPTVITIVSAPNLGSATKTVADLNGGPFEPGDVVQYTITVTNTGSAAATNVVVTDAVDPNLTDVTPLDGGTLAGSTITWTIGAIAPGETRTVRFTAMIRSPLFAGTAISNQGWLTTPELPGTTLTDDPATAAPGDPTIFVVTSAADLTTSTITYEDLNGGAPQPGDQIRYTVTVVNIGNSPGTAIVVTVVMDPAFGVVTPEDGGVWDPLTRTVTWTAPGPLDPGGAPLVFHVTAQLAPGTPNGTVVCESATIDSAQSSPFSTAEVCFTVESRPDFAPSEKTVIDMNGGAVVPGDVLGWQIAVVNGGTQDGVGVVVTDVVDANLVGVTPLDGGVFDAATRTITWTIPLVPAGGNVIVRFDATVASPLDDGTVIANQGAVTCAACPTPELTDDPTTPALDDPTVVVVTSQPVFTLTKAFVDDDGGVLDPGDAVTYTITLTNDGTSCADDVVVVDPVDADLEAVVVEQGGVFDAGTSTVTWSGATTPALARLCTGPANAVTLVVRATVRSPLADGTLVCNQAQVTSEEVGTPVLSDDPSTPAPGDETCRTVVSGAIFANATKTVVDPNGAPARPGDVLVWTISFTNEGNANAFNVLVRDVLDPNLTMVAPQSGGAIVGNEIRWDATTTPELALVAVGQTVTLGFTAVIASPLDDGTVISNQAVITAEKGVTIPLVTDDPATPAPGDPTVVVVTSAADLSATKTVVDENGGVPAPGDVFLYTITLVNAGDANAAGVVVTDTLAPTLSFVEALDGGVYDAASRTITWTAGLVSPGAPVALRFRAAAVKPLANGTAVPNQATFTGGGSSGASDDPATPAPADPTVIVVVAAPDLTASEKTVSPSGTVAVGTILTWEIRVVNAGDATATGVVVTDPVDVAHLDEVTPLDGGAFDAGTGTITWSIPSVEPGLDAVVRFTARVRFDAPDATIVANQASITSAEVLAPALTDDPSDPTPDDPTEVVVDATPELIVTKTVEDQDGPPTGPGDLLTFTIQVEVVGPAHGYDVVVTDPIPANLVDVTPGQGGQIVGGQLLWDPATTPALAHLVPGAPVTLSFTARVAELTPDGAVISNQATVAAGGRDGLLPSDDPSTPAANDPTSITIVAAPIVEATKTVEDLNGGTVVPGDELIYTIRVTNEGTAPATGVVVFDPLPAQTEYVPNTTLLDGALVPDVGGGSALGTPPGLSLGTVMPGPGGARTVTWRVRVVASALMGTVISNQAFVSDDRGVTEPSDDPGTVAPDDPTQVVVGGGPLLTTATKTYDPTPVGDDGDGLFEPGEEIAYRITIQNTGDAPAPAVVLTDPLPASTSWVAGSLRLGGQALTDPADGDAGEQVGGVVTVRAGTLAPGQVAEIAFRVRIDAEPAGGFVENQGTVTSDATPPEPTDADGNDANGDQPTMTPVGAAPALAVTKSASDLTGGVVIAGDELLYTITLGNSGARPLTGVALADTLPDAVAYVDGSLSWPGGTVTGQVVSVTGIELDPAETVTITLRVRLRSGDDAPIDGEEICNVAVARLGKAQLESLPACVVTGGVVGAGRLEGRAYIERKARDRAFQPDQDEPLPDLQIQVFRDGDSRGAPLAGVLTDEEGRYRLNALPPGSYVIRAFSRQGTQLAMVGRVVVEDGRVTEQDVWIDPSGRVYDAVSGRYVASVRALLYYDEDDPDEPGRLVPPERLQPGQQGQITGTDGIYKFDVLPGRRYRLVVEPGASTWSFPSQLAPPEPGVAPPGPVVPDDRPSVAPDAVRTYYLRFAPERPGDDVTNNHVPLDPLATQVRLDKRADRFEASLGEIVVYTVTVENRSARDLTAAGGTPVYVLDAPERGLSYLKAHAAAKIAKGHDVVTLRPKEQVTSPGSGTLVRWGPFDLPAGARLTLAYQVVVGVDTRQGVYRNRAVLVDAAGVELSNHDEVKLRVVNDPIFDEALVIGRVWCDADGDGRPGASERGVHGARVYVDTGSYAVTDATGKWHLSRIPPGIHLVKLDVATLPPGSKLGAGVAESVILHLTRGLPAKVDFAVSCGDRTTVDPTTAGVGSIKLSGKTRRPARPEKPTLPRTSTTITGDLGAMIAAVDGMPIELPRADVELVVDPALALPPGEGAPNLVPPPPGGGWTQARPVFRGAWTAAADAESWTLAIHRVTVQGELRPFRTIAGQGAPGDVAWDGIGDDGRPVARDAVYVYQISVQGAGGVAAASARRSFGVGYGLPAAEERTEVLRGNFFGGSAKRPTAKRALEQQVKALAGRIGPEDTITIEVHADGTGDRLKRIAETQKQADRVKEMLVAAGVQPSRIKARGRGSLDPIAGTRSARDRARNRRVVVRITPPPPVTAGADVPAPAPGTPDALVDGQPATLDEAGRFVRNVPTPPDGTILLDLVAADGRRAVTTIQVEAPEGARPPAPRPTAGARTVRVEGDLAAGTLEVDGVAIDTSLLAIDARIAGAGGGEPSYAVVTPKKPRAKRRRRGDPPPPPAPGPRLERSIAFELTAPSSIEVARWELVVRRDAADGQGEVVYRTGGDGFVPSTASWDGQDPGGRLVVASGQRYLYQIVVEDRAGHLAESPPRAFTVGVGQRGGFAPIQVAGTLFTGKNEPGAGLKNQIARFASAIARRPATETYQLVILMALPARVSLTEAKVRLAARVARTKAYLGRLKVPLDRVQISGDLLFDDTPRQARRDSVTITAVPAAPSAPARIVVGGQEVPFDGGAFSAAAEVPAGGAVVIDVTLPDGHRATWIVAPPAAAAAPTNSNGAPAAPADDGLIEPTWRAGAGAADGADAGGAGGGAETGGERLMAPGEVDGRERRLDRGPAVTLAFGDDESEFGGDVLDDALGDPAAGGARGGRPAGTAGQGAGRLIAEAGTGILLEVPPQVLAADLTVELPPRGLKLGSPDLAVAGRTHPKNKVRINGREIVTRADGRFEELVTLPLGGSTLTIEAIDPDGNVATISWPVEVSETEHFLLVLADGAVSSAYAAGAGAGWTADGAALDGWGAHDTTRVGHVLLYGRVALYYKGRIRGGEIFRQYRVTAHVDTAKRAAFQEFFQELIDPERDYAVYGDSAEEIRDVNARGKLYLLVEADESRALVGNFKSNLRLGDLFRYDRTVYGAEVDFRKQFGAVKQRIHAFGSLGDARLMRDVNVFRATGGSLYYLRHGRLVEGGERVRVIVRDRDNGLVLSERAFLRERDYVIDYVGGRIMFKEPIASTAESTFIIDNFESSQTPLDGHPVYVEVTYEYEVEDGDAGAAGGVVLRDTYFDTLAVGAGIVGEDRDGSGAFDDYLLVGADVAWRPRKRTVLRAEVARSEATDAGTAISLDGGLTFKGLDAIGFTAPDAGRGGHNAWKLEVDTQLGDFVKSAWAEGTRVRLYAQDLDRGFSSGGTILEQGRLKLGGQASYRLGATDTLFLRHDAEIATLPRVGPTPETLAMNPDPLGFDERATYVTTLKWQRATERWGLKLEGAHQAVSSESAIFVASPECSSGACAYELDTHRYGVGALFTYHLSKRLTLRAGQEAQFAIVDDGAIDPTLRPIMHHPGGVDTADPWAGVATTAGADWTLSPGLKLSGTGALRWNGDAATQIGLKTPIGRGSMYVNQRLEDRGGRLISTSVLGAEDRFGAGGRTYGEYQIESGVLGIRNRAVLGVGHRWNPLRGLNLALGFEHQLNFGGYLPDGTPTADNQRFVGHVGAEYLRRDRLKASATIEARFDDGMHGVGPGTSLGQEYTDLLRQDPRGVTPPDTFPDHGGAAPGAPLVIPPGERLQIVAAAGLTWKWDEDWTFLGRFRLSHTEDLTNHDPDGLPDGVDKTFTAARFVEATCGWAYRPLRIDWLDVLVKYSYLLDMRPIGPAGQGIENESHVVSLAPIVDLPLRLQLGGKVAWKRTTTDAEVIEGEVLSATVDAFLWLTRLGWRFHGNWDVAAEYRVLGLVKPGGGELKHGALLELDYHLGRHVRLGVGYNFSRFSDDELRDLERDTHGLFFRVVGRF